MWQIYVENIVTKIVSRKGRQIGRKDGRPTLPSKLGGWVGDFIENRAFGKCHSFPRIATHFWTSLYDDICSHI